ncbi:permease [Sulfurimonas sp. HSL3-7]|uniref:permease n=1 Tax=Sulfonitrofixus jiaomeiensis TaxID=3131938 RepID=UPI0031F8F356
MKKEQRSKPANLSGWILLGVTIILYGVTAFLDASTARAALGKSLGVLKMIAPILLIVFFLMALLNTFIKPKSIAKHLGRESGLKGWFFALAGGVISHGPGYIWYPMLSELRDHNARDGLIIAFLYARAIKLPWLPVMVGYFGIAFTLVLIFYILLGAWIQGLLADKMASKNRTHL